MNIRVAQANSVRLASHAVIADIDVVIACGQIDAGARAQSDVEAAGSVPKKGERTVGTVFCAGRVDQQRRSTGGRILVCRVEKERPSSSGRVKLAFCVAAE